LSAKCAAEISANQHGDGLIPVRDFAAIIRREVEAPLLARIAELEADKRRLELAIGWALGQVDDFPPQPVDGGKYWWRSELRRRAGIR
jgi:hypothetical protein